MSEIVGDEACPQCRAEGGDKTGNHLIVFADGNKYCNRCNYTELNGAVQPDDNEEDDLPEILDLSDIENLPLFGIPDKLIKSEAVTHYGVRTEFNEQGEPTAYYYPHSKDGKLTGYKKKTTEKNFYSLGDCKDGELFGQSVVKAGGKFLVITEGENDALSAWQVLREGSSLEGWNPPVVSLSHGAASAVRDMARNLEYISSFAKIILCFDMDGPGQEAVKAVSPLLSPGSVYIAKLDLKDANDLLVAGRGDELKWDLLKHAQRYQPDGIINGSDTWDRYRKSIDQDCIPYPADWVDTNRKTYGFRLGQIITITSGTGVGKTQLLRELKHHCWETTDYLIGDISLEEDVGESVAGIMSVHSGNRLHLPDHKVDESFERRIHGELFDDGRFTFYDHFGGMDDSSLFNKIRYLGATGHKIIFLDHLSIVVSEFAAEGNERQRIDTVMTKLAKIAKELEIALFIVVHLRKEGSGRSFEQGATPSLDDLRGSGTLKQLSWDVIALSRNQQHSNVYCRNISKVTVLKCRFSGRTGTSDYLLFDEDTGRMRTVDAPPDYEERQ